MTDFCPESRFLRHDDANKPGRVHPVVRADGRRASLACGALLAAVVGRRSTRALAAAPAIAMYSYVLLVHVLGATIWTGGHLVLASAVLPRALATRDPAILLAFESGFERVGMPALLVQVVTGAWMAHAIQPDILGWFSLADPVSRLITLKFALLLATVVTALDARLRIIPRLSARTLPAMARRVVFVTLLSVGFVVAGVSFRGGLLA